MIKEKLVEKLTKDIWEAGGSDLMVSDMSEIRQIAESLTEQGYCQQNEVLQKVQERFNNTFNKDDSLNILIRQIFEQIVREISKEKN